MCNCLFTMKARTRWVLVGLLTSVFLLSCLILLTVGGPQSNQELCDNPGRTDNSTSISFPKILHQIWLQGGQIPMRWKKHTDKCRKLYRGHQYNLWSNTDIEKFISKHYPHMLSLYKKYPYDVQRTDCARYLILHYYGGMYLDADIRCKSSVEPYLDNLINTYPQKQVVSREAFPKSLGTEIIIAKPNSGIMKRLVTHLEEYSTVNYFFNYLTIMYSTGPAFYGSMYYSYACPDQLQIVTQDLTRYFSHGCYAHWQSWDGKLISKIHYRWKSYTALGLLLALVLYLLYRRIRQRLARRGVL